MQSISMRLARDLLFLRHIVGSMDPMIRGESQRGRVDSGLFERINDGGAMHRQHASELTAIRPAMALVVRYGVPAVSAALTEFLAGTDPDVSATIAFVLPVFMLLSGGVNIDDVPGKPNRFAFVATSALSKAMIVVAMLLAAIVFLGKGVETMRLAMLEACLFVPLMTLGSVFAVWLALQRGFREPPRRAAIIGVTESSLRFAQTLVEDPFVSAELVGFFEDRNPSRLPCGERVPIIGTFGQARAVVSEHGISDVFIALPMMGERRMGEIMEQLLDSPASVHFLPDFVAFRPIHENVNWVKGIPVYTVIGRPDIGLSGVIKRYFDFVCAGIGLVVLAPLLLLVATLIKLESPGPVLFRQTRHGADGRPFQIYKFRSMTTAACASGHVAQATRNDARVTRLGRFLRKSSIDELPQLVNVLRGEMSLVGPRPHAAQHNELYRGKIRGYMLRHKVRPGLTGWAQVHGLRGETETIEKMANRVRFDLEYMRRWSFGLDLYIVLRTFRQLAKGV